VLRRRRRASGSQAVGHGPKRTSAGTGSSLAVMTVWPDTGPNIRPATFKGVEN
jgi:hypothetical protein